MSKKLVVLGATGPTGKCLVQEALKQGHHVNAVVRNPSKLSDLSSHENLKVSEANIFDAESLKKEFLGADAVMSCLGASVTPPWGTVTLYSTTIKSITEAMKAVGLKRLICLTSAGQVIEGNVKPPLVTRLFLNYFIRSVLDDMIRMEAFLREGCEDIDYTVLRPTGLTNEIAKEAEPVIKENVHYDTECYYRIPRANVARVMMEAFRDGKWLKSLLFVTMPMGT